MDRREKERNNIMYWLIEDDQVETLIDSHVDTLTDLSISDLQAELTKGGLLLPAVQKVREAASR
jgi:hypothetical protein